MYLQRTIEKFLRKAARHFPVILITGARQVGKTTLLKTLAEPERKYITLDDPVVLQLAKTDPALFFQRYKTPLIIDEIQYAPELLPYIKMMVDRTGKKNLFWLTGSQHFHIMKGLTESLAGRVAILHLMGFSFSESKGEGLKVKPFLPKNKISVKDALEDRLSLMDVYSHIFRGSFPALHVEPEMDWNLFYSSYVQTYLQRDVVEIINVVNRISFIRFLKAVAARTAQLLNLSDLARDADISPNTAKKWLSVLQASGIVYLLQPFHTNLSKRLVKAPKLYFLDTGLCAWLTEWSSPETLEAGALSGAIFETWIFTEILKTYLHNGLEPSFYYYHDKDRKEIDLLIFKNGRVYPVEIKKTASPNRDMVSVFKSLKRLGLNIASGCLICLCNDILPLMNNVYALPVDYLFKEF
ncbi:MAG TPA: ATP-binding protein [Nitrospirae bacterium]|nr:ATP-binding protein [Nitrospirota bacterium]